MTAKRRRTNKAEGKKADTSPLQTIDQTGRLLKQLIFCETVQLKMKRGEAIMIRQIFMRSHPSFKAGGEAEICAQNCQSYFSNIFSKQVLSLLKKVN